MIYNKIEQIRNERNITQKRLSELIGRSREWYVNLKRTDNLTVSDLLKVAKELDVPVKVFFEGETHGNLNDIQAAYNIKKSADEQLLEIMQELKNQLRVKDDQIAFLQHLIEDMHK